MIIKCHNCQKSLRVDDRMAGKKGRCPACKQIITISNSTTLKNKKISSTPVPPPITPKTKLTSTKVASSMSTNRQLESRSKNTSKIQKQTNKPSQKDPVKNKEKRIRIGEFRQVFPGVKSKHNVAIAFKGRFVVRDAYQHVCHCDPSPLLSIFTQINFIFVCWSICLGLFIIGSFGFIPSPVIILCFNLFFGGPLAFHFAQRSILRMLVHHFEQETGHPIADPDLGLEKTVPRVSYTPIRVFVMGPNVKTEYLKHYWVENVERGEYMPGNWTPGPAQIQSVLNRHWAYHARKQDSLIPISQSDTSNAPSINDWVKAIALTSLTGWFVFIIINKVTRKCYELSGNQEYLYKQIPENEATYIQENSLVDEKT